jgi:hypothetical protein
MQKVIDCAQITNGTKFQSLVIMNGVFAWCRRGCSLAVPRHGRYKWHLRWLLLRGHNSLIPDGGRPQRQPSCNGPARRDLGEGRAGCGGPSPAVEHSLVAASGPATTDGVDTTKTEQSWPTRLKHKKWHKSARTSYLSQPKISPDIWRWNESMTSNWNVSRS